MREYSQLSEQQRIALRGRAQLGEVTTTVVHLKESKQFKVGFTLKVVFKLLLRPMHSSLYTLVVVSTYNNIKV
jgi:hypothetical protein